MGGTSVGGGSKFWADLNVILQAMESHPRLWNEMPHGALSSSSAKKQEELKTISEGPACLPGMRCHRKKRRTVPASTGRCSKMPSTGCLWQQTFVTKGSWEVHDLGASQFSSWEGPLSCSPTATFLLHPRKAEKEEASSLVQEQISPFTLILQLTLHSPHASSP